MTHIRFTATVVAAALAILPISALAQDGLSSYQAIVSVADQKIAVLRDGAVIARYPISTSKYGVGDGLGSYKTPLGKMKVCEKLGGDLPTGAVIKHRRATGEVIAVNAPGRDPIVTRVLWLDGLEAGNAHAKDRSIYIHGTAEERNIGKPASYGCIRMKSEDVIALYNDLNVGATISVIQDKLPKLAKYTPPKPQPIAKAAPPTPTPAPKVEVVKVEATKAPERPSAKVLAAIAESKEDEAKKDREAHAAARVAKVEPIVSKPAKSEKPASAPPAIAKLEPAPATVARPEKAPAPVANSNTAPRLAVARHRTEPKPIAVPAPVDPDRLQFLRNRETSLASMRFPSDLSSNSAGAASTMDLAGQLKGSILESGLSIRDR